MPLWFLYVLALVCCYLGIVEPILEKVLKRELILEHFWIIPTSILTEKEQKRLMVGSYLVSLFVLVTLLCMNISVPGS